VLANGCLGYFTRFGGNCWEALGMLILELDLELKKFMRFHFMITLVFGLFSERSTRCKSKVILIVRNYPLKRSSAFFKVDGRGFMFLDIAEMIFD
jgi:hypothetical protein